MPDLCDGAGEIGGQRKCLHFFSKREGKLQMKREMGIARCGLACCLCSENDKCGGCASDGCPGAAWCENRKCSIEKAVDGCYACGESCSKGLLGKIKPAGFRAFIRRYGMEELLDCLERNEKNGVVYHKEGIIGDYDGFEDAEALIAFIRSGKI